MLTNLTYMKHLQMVKHLELQTYQYFGGNNIAEYHFAVNIFKDDGNNWNSDGNRDMMIWLTHLANQISSFPFLYLSEEQEAIWTCQRHVTSAL